MPKATIGIYVSCSAWPADGLDGGESDRGILRISLMCPGMKSLVNIDVDLSYGPNGTGDNAAEITRKVMKKAYSMTKPENGEEPKLPSRCFDQLSAHTGGQHSEFTAAIGTIVIDDASEVNVACTEGKVRLNVLLNSDCHGRVPGPGVHLSDPGSAPGTVMKWQSKPEAIDCFDARGKRVSPDDPLWRVVCDPRFSWRRYMLFVLFPRDPAAGARSFIPGTIDLPLSVPSVVVPVEVDSSAIESQIDEVERRMLTAGVSLTRTGPVIVPTGLGPGRAPVGAIAYCSPIEVVGPRASIPWEVALTCPALDAVAHAGASRFSTPSARLHRSHLERFSRRIARNTTRPGGGKFSPEIPDVGDDLE